VFLVAGTACTSDEVAPPAKAAPLRMAAPPGGKADPASYRGRVFYELWVRSFQDSDGDGIGDFKGLTSRLDELADLGIGGIWLMPTFPSPLADSGYDVADYTAVHPDYGTLGDLDAFLKEAHKRNILVYLDMVFNHTSDEHKWFQAAITSPVNPYHDYYVWAPAPASGCSDVIAGPFGTTRWTKNATVGAYYFHQFYPRQPDLNFESPALRAALLDVLQFWMDRGVDGFRFDVPDRYFEDGDKCAHTAKTLAFHADLRTKISGGTGKLARGFVGEIWGMHKEVEPFFGPAGDPMIFNFMLMYSFYAAGMGLGPGPVAVEVQNMLGVPAESRWGVILGNHDTPRFADVAQNDPQRMRLGAALEMTLPGVPFMWMGDELGLRMGPQVRIDWRDGSRTPYPWAAADPGHGFTKAKTPHLAYSPDSASRAYDVQRADPESLLNYYRRLIAARNGSPALNDGGFEEVYRDAAVWVFRRYAEGESVWVAMNFGNAEQSIRLTGDGVPAALTDLLTGEPVSRAAAVPLAPYQTRLLR
jgi:glycosidase